MGEIIGACVAIYLIYLVIKTIAKKFFKVEKTMLLTILYLLIASVFCTYIFYLNSKIFVLNYFIGALILMIIDYLSMAILEKRRGSNE